MSIKFASYAGACASRVTRYAHAPDPLYFPGKLCVLHESNRKKTEYVSYSNAVTRKRKTQKVLFPIMRFTPNPLKTLEQKRKTDYAF